MENISPLNVPALLRQFNLRPDKRLGQNFLMDDHALRKITDIAEIAPDEVVLEIGPGLGSLTRHLARKAHQVVAVELDERLIPALRHVLDPYPNVRILQGDILRQDIQQLVQSPAYLVVANIPYYITGYLFRIIGDLDKKPKTAVFTVQKEVGTRMETRSSSYYDTWRQ